MRFSVLNSGSCAITPTQHLLFGSKGQTDSEDNQSSPVYFKGHGGVGLYALRPTKYKRPTLLLAGTFAAAIPKLLALRGISRWVPPASGVVLLTSGLLTLLARWS